MAPSHSLRTSPRPASLTRRRALAAALMAACVALSACASDTDTQVDSGSLLTAPPTTVSPDSNQTDAAQPAATDPATEPVTSSTAEPVADSTPPSQVTESRPAVLALARETLAGSTLEVDQYTGRDVLVWFWAPW